MKWIQNSFGSTPSQNAEGLHFGLGRDDKLVQVNVRWPYKNTRQIKYFLKKFKFKNDLDFTLCESGKIIVGRPKLNSCL